MVSFDLHLRVGVHIGVNSFGIPVLQRARECGNETVRRADATNARTRIRLRQRKMPRAKTPRTIRLNFNETSINPLKRFGWFYRGRSLGDKFIMDLL